MGDLFKSRERWQSIKGGWLVVWALTSLIRAGVVTGEEVVVVVLGHLGGPYIALLSSPPSTPITQLP
ncbi:hypothetical protein E2C01_086610 [Portunus trituberculatus]|uniref:Uncharacterized protein n=1 Tax=Portunus trituberculatus TaxID=210409 RepID=A0A5B7JA64_PORTR|nr:hypothetical protein [Portunus trituberculatus]